MAKGRAEQQDRMAWNHTSHLLAVLINAHRDPKKGRPVTPEQLNPYAGDQRRGKGIPLNRDNIRMLKKAFVDGRK